jgi:hypothetical protein
VGGLRCIVKYHTKEALTKDIDSKLSIDWRKEPIHEMNEPPSNVEGDCNWKKNDTSIRKKNNVKKKFIILGF